MKTDIHPKVNPVVFVDSSTGAEFLTTSVLTSDEKKTIDGVEYYVIKLDITSDSHPFYTGKQKLIDSTGRVDKFRARMEQAKKFQEEQAAKNGGDDGQGDDDDDQGDDGQAGGGQGDDAAAGDDKVKKETVTEEVEVKEEMAEEVVEEVKAEEGAGQEAEEEASEEAGEEK